MQQHFSINVDGVPRSAPPPYGRQALPQLKGVVWERVGGELRVVYDRREQLLVSDPDGRVEALFDLLLAGGRTVEELASVLSRGFGPVPVSDVREVLAELDACGLIEDGRRLGTLAPDEAERHFSNLAFFESFASLDRSREDFHHALRAAHVLVLGTGGLNSNVIPHLCGLGVGRLTLLDRDAVEPRNFARQYLYRWADIGARKVARAAGWVRGFDPSIEVEQIDTDIESPDQLGELLDQYRPDVVASGIDHPGGVDTWVNAACVPRGVPFVRGGMWVTEGTVYSIDPGASACLACPLAAADRDGAAMRGADAEETTVRAGLLLHATKPRTNRGIGPVAGLLGALAAFELLRYLTRFEPPAYAANPLHIDFADGCAMSQRAWAAAPECAVCGGGPGPAPVRRDGPYATVEGR
jgi:molybdopterin/thiamine biosynthesis adenylyltransferase